MQDEDLYICGYQPDENGMVKDLVLGYFEGSSLKSRGKVYLGVSKTERKIIKEFAKSHRISIPWFEAYSDKNIIWIKPELIGTIKYMHTTDSGRMRQPVWKGLRE